MPGSTRKPRSRKPSLRLAGPSSDDYQMVLLWSKEDQCFVVTLPAWQNARTHGRTVAEAARNAREVLGMLIESALEHGEPVPPPERRY